MKKIKMLRNREVGQEVFLGEHSYVLADAVANALLVDGHAVLVEVVPEVKKEKAPRVVLPLSAVGLPQPKSEPEHNPEPEPETGEKEESVSKRKKK